MSCFRDDIVFLIYLYQRHIYPVDKESPVLFCLSQFFKVSLECRFLSISGFLLCSFQGMFDEDFTENADDKVEEPS